ncbi:P-loop NTPase family protein [Geomesophilobacter sediminis]|uniref:Uncharacterized protein n=1 Tax=Geomesophilobacter sediminis TaxID=2798584 RepID=A0A8J7JDE5_9BACT|nr:hypothetical protein [Geomesophilobacter sediminis]MBJ6725346.1 hypothetical protein [Geomesophilobacter sediminis]
MSKIYRALEQARQELTEPESDAGAGWRMPVRKDTLLPPQRQGSRVSAEHNAYIEICRAFETQLALHSKKTVQVICSRRGEGVSTVVKGIALTSAERLGKRVLIIDTSSRYPEWVMAGGQRPHGGPVPVSTCFKAGRENLCVAFLPLDAAAIWLSPVQSGRDILAELSDYFDLILIDSPSFEESPDGIDLARHADGVIIVVEAERTKWFLVDNLKEKILNNEGRLLGVVLNKRRFHIPEPVYRWFH